MQIGECQSKILQLCSVQLFVLVSGNSHLVVFVLCVHRDETPRLWPEVSSSPGGADGVESANSVRRKLGNNKYLVSSVGRRSYIGDSLLQHIRTDNCISYVQDTSPVSSPPVSLLPKRSAEVFVIDFLTAIFGFLVRSCGADPK